MKDPKAIRKAIMTAKSVAGLIDPHFGRVPLPDLGGFGAKKPVPEHSPAVHAIYDEPMPEHFARGGLPTLKPAIRHKGKVYSSITDHLSALSQIEDPEDYRNARMDAENRGYVNERGHFMDRYRAQGYAKDHGLVRHDAPEWAHSTPELISENLMRFPEQEARNQRLLSGEGYAAGGDVESYADGGTADIDPELFRQHLKRGFPAFADGGDVEEHRSKRGPSMAKSDLFDMGMLHEVPGVEQHDIPRNVPARGVPERVKDLMVDRNIFDRAMKVIEEGRAKGGHKWYNAEPLRHAFVVEHGKDRGNEAFRKFMDFVAATSPRSEVGANVRNASYYYGRHMRGEGMPEIGERNPQPYGHMAQRLHQMNAQRIAGAGWDPLNNPKPASFAQNLMGNQAPATVDTHAFRLPAILAQDPRFLETAYQSNKDAPKQNIQKMVQSGEIPIEEALKKAAYWQTMPKENEYGAMEQFYKKLAQEAGITPAQAQASAWVGGGHLTGLASDESKPFMGFLQDRIYKTATETNRDPKDVLKGFIRGESPLRASGGRISKALAIAKGVKKK